MLAIDFPMRPAKNSILAALLSLLCLPGFSVGNAKEDVSDRLRSSSQHLLVMAEHDSATRGMLYRFERSAQGWAQVGNAIPVCLGRAGLAKTREGDGKAPSGVFGLEYVFGYADAKPAWLRMPYAGMSNEHECVDDASSAYYNRILSAAELSGKADWNSSEMMRRDIHYGDDLYKFGIVVDYNTEGAMDTASGKGAGSCIFIHTWSGPAIPTAGCTGLSEKNLLTLLRWLHDKHTPLLVQGSRAYLEALARTGALPYPLPG